MAVKYEADTNNFERVFRAQTYSSLGHENRK